MSTERDAGQISFRRVVLKVWDSAEEVWSAAKNMAVTAAISAIVLAVLTALWGAAGQLLALFLAVTALSLARPALVSVWADSLSEQLGIGLGLVGTGIAFFVLTGNAFTVYLVVAFLALLSLAFLVVWQFLDRNLSDPPLWVAGVVLPLAVGLVVWGVDPISDKKPISALHEQWVSYQVSDSLASGDIPGALNAHKERRGEERLGAPMEELARLLRESLVQLAGADDFAAASELAKQAVPPLREVGYFNRGNSDPRQQWTRILLILALKASDDPETVHLASQL